jgi:hypothetical protein
MAIFVAEYVAAIGMQVPLFRGTSSFTLKAYSITIFPL